MLFSKKQILLKNTAENQHQFNPDAGDYVYS